MLGIVEIKTGKVFATAKKFDLKFQRLLQRIEQAYPDRKFRIDEVSDLVICTGDVPKTVYFERNVGSN